MKTHHDQLHPSSNNGAQRLLPWRAQMVNTVESHENRWTTCAAEMCVLTRRKQSCEQWHESSHTSTSWFDFSWNRGIDNKDDLNVDGWSRAIWMALPTSGGYKSNRACGPGDFTHFALTSGPRPALRTATGELLKHYGLRTVYFWCRSKELQLQGATAVCARRHNLTQCDCARIVCVVCVLFVFRSTSLSSKSDAPRGQTVLAKLRCSTPLRRTEWTLRLFPKQCGVCRRWRRDFL